MNISALTSSLPNPLSEAIQLLAASDFSWIDVPPTAAQPQHRKLIADLGLQIGCVGLEKEMPGDFDLASGSRAGRDAAIEYFRGALDAVAELGVRASYLTPPLATDTTTRELWSDSIGCLADHAQQCAVDLCIEHFPTRLLHSGADTLAWLAEMQHPSLKLLIDVGHCLISREDPADLIRAAGDLLGYLHFDDNDGKDDLHWGLLQGICTNELLHKTIATAAECGYERCLCLEFNPNLDAPLETLKAGQVLLGSLSRTAA